VTVNSIQKRVLLVRLDHMGDVVLTVPPVARSLRSSYPDVEIDVLTTGIGRSLLAADPAITRIFVFDAPWSVVSPGPKSNSKISWLKRCAAFLHEHGLRGPADYDWIVYLSFSPWERFLTRFWSSKRVGFSGVYKRLSFRVSNHLLTHKRSFDVSLHSTDNALNLVAAALTLTKQEKRTHLFASEVVRRRGAELLNSLSLLGERLLIVHSGTNRSMKAWPLANYLEVADRLGHTFGMKSVFVGREEEIRYMREACAELGRAEPILLDTSQIEDLMGIALHASLFLANDGGPLHIAAALGVPTLGVFGPTDERVFGPRGAFSSSVRQPGICGRRYYPWQVPSCCQVTGRECLREVKVSTVFDAAAALLAENSDRIQSVA
jgi:lipopolysaccharide heptosyltransferase III